MLFLIEGVVEVFLVEVLMFFLIEGVEGMVTCGGADVLSN